MKSVAQDPQHTVLFLDNSRTFGGALNSLSYLVEGMPRTPWAPVVVSAQPEAELRRHFPDTTVVLAVPKLRWMDDRFFRRATNSLLLGRGPVRALAGSLRGSFWVIRHDLPQGVSYARMARNLKVALVHLNNNVESQLSGIIAARLLRVPCVAHARSFQPPSLATRAYLGRVDRHIAISSAIRTNLIELGADPERISVIPDALPIDRFRRSSDPSDVRREFSIEPADRCFGFFGRLVAWKGVEEFLSAAFEVLRRDPAARAFVVGGPSDGEPGYARRLQERCRASGFGDRIEFTGYRADVAPLMHAMDVVVHSSVEPEPFGMVLIEAMAVGRPVIATRGGGPEDIVIHGETGLLVSPSSTSEMSEAILSILQAPETAGQMGLRGLERAKTHYDAARYCSEVVSVYRNLRPEIF